MNNKVAIIGTGHVGATAAHVIAQRELADVALIDIVEGMAKGKAIDIMQAAAIQGSGIEITGGESFSLVEGSDIVVITAGFPRGPGMSRSDLINKNAPVIESVIEKVNAHAPDSIIVIVTNPVDEMTLFAFNKSGRPRSKVFGMGGALDTGRFIYFISRRLGADASDVEAMVVGAHGDAMIPLVRQAKVKGEQLADLLDPLEMDELVESTKKGGAQIISLLKQGSAFYAPGTGVASIVEAIVKDTREVIPCCAVLDGEYDLSGTSIGVPVMIGREGIIKIVETDLSDEETAVFMESAVSIRQALESIG